MEPKDFEKMKLRTGVINATTPLEYLYKEPLPGNSIIDQLLEVAERIEEFYDTVCGINEYMIGVRGDRMMDLDPERRKHWARMGEYFGEKSKDTFPNKVLNQQQLETYKDKHWKIMCLAHNLVFGIREQCPHCIEAATSAWSEEIK